MYPGGRSGSQNPKWRDQVRRGVNATTEYSRSGVIVDKVEPLTYDFSATCSPGEVNKGSSRYSGEILQHPPFAAFGYATACNAVSAQNQAIMSFISDAKAQYNSISGPVFLAELRQTLNMIRNPAQALRAKVDTYLSYLSGRRATHRTKREAEDFLAKSWLEYSFGWTPLIADTKAGAEALARLIHGDLRYSTARGFGRSECAGRPTINNVNVRNFTLGTEEVRVDTFETCIIKGGVSAKPTGPTLANAMHLFGFTPEEFVPTIWELIPYSFLADYFLNIGDILEATFFDRSGITWTSKTTISEKTYSRTVAHKKQASVWSGSSTGGSQKIRYKSMNRTKITPLVPTIEVSLPGHPQQWINMAALAATHKKLVPFFR